MFRSCGFAPLQRFPLLKRVQAYCILLPDLGFIAFPTFVYRNPHEAARKMRTSFGAIRDFSRDADHTLRRKFLSESRTVSPRPLPACCFDNFQVLLLQPVCVETTSLPTLIDPFLPWALFPFKVLFRKSHS